MECMEPSHHKVTVANSYGAQGSGGQGYARMPPTGLKHARLWRSWAGP